ncbi:MAG: hypothetical protein Q8P18_24170 [Pseudomonadota bacterium]|nr:hypothetical protein [Pseudomonadota bacterium]
MLLSLLLTACTDTRVLAGEVRDVWGKPVSDATVVIEGLVERYRSDSAGKFTIDTENPVTRVMAGKDGYIKDIELVPIPAEEGDDYDPLTFGLYPEPEQPGFYGVGRAEYIHLEARRIRVVGTELKHYAGLQDIAEQTMGSGEPAAFVFSSTLRASELARMNLHLTRLDFVDHTRVKGVLGAMDATVNLWVAGEEVAFDLKALPARDAYLITTREPVEAGMYAFHAQDVLNEEDERVLMNLPKEMQVAFPFEVL